jgi:hypothetical protein
MRKPFAILVPDYTATKAWYKVLIDDAFSPTMRIGRNPGVPKPSKNDARVSLKAATEALKKGKDAGTGSLGSLFASHPALRAAQQAAAAAAAPEGAEEQQPAVAAPPAATGLQSRLPFEPFYVLPQKLWYNFAHPTGAGHGASHFRSMWIVWAGERTPDVAREAQCAALATQGGAAADDSDDDTGRRRPHRIDVVPSLDALVRGGLVKGGGTGVKGTANHF